MDTNLVLRDGTSNLTADETLTSVKIGPMVKPLWLHIVVPSITATDTIDVELEFCDSGLPTTEVYNQNMKQITAAGHYAVPFFTTEEYLQVKLNITDVGGGGFDAGAVKVWIDNANRYLGPVLT
jgi:hypothetical protein